MHSKPEESSSSEPADARTPVGLMPDSEVFVSRLGIGLFQIKHLTWWRPPAKLFLLISFSESKLKRISSKNPNKITGKDLIKNMSEFKEMYMTDYLRNRSKVGNDDLIIDNHYVDLPNLNEKEKSFLEVSIQICLKYVKIKKISWKWQVFN